MSATLTLPVRRTLVVPAMICGLESPSDDPRHCRKLRCGDQDIGARRASGYSEARVVAHAVGQRVSGPHSGGKIIGLGDGVFDLTTDALGIGLDPLTCHVPL